MEQKSTIKSIIFVKDFTPCIFILLNFTLVMFTLLILILLTIPFMKYEYFPSLPFHQQVHLLANNELYQRGNRQDTQGC